MRIRYHDSFPVAQIDDSNGEFQARVDYDEEEISRLAEDIERNGLRNAIGLRKNSDLYQIIWGFQRVKAVKKLGLETIKANVYEDLTDDEAREQAISDNVRHGDLTDHEKAKECLKLKEKGYSVDHLCTLFGVKKSIVYNYLSVANLDTTTKYCLHEDLITLNHAVELARIQDVSKRLETLQHVVAWKWSVKDLRMWLTNHSSPIMSVWLAGWIPLCPKNMKATGLEECRKCEHHRGGSDSRNAVGCGFPTPAEIRPLTSIGV
jgi:ParB/RepB/Spo0J family partition protein